MKAVLTVLQLTAITGVGGTGLGGALGAAFGKMSRRVTSLLLSFSAGLMISIVCFDLIVSAVSPGDSASGTNLLLVTASILVGYGAVLALNALITGPHGPKEGKKQKPSGRMLTAGLVMASAIALHNFPEGMVIGAAYANDPAGRVLAGDAVLIASVIGIHDIPEGMGVSVPLVSGGMGRLKATVLTALSGVPTVLGAVAGYFLGAMSPMALAISLSFASGAMLCVVFGELMPEAFFLWRSGFPAFAMFVGLLLGMVIVYS